MELVKTFNKVKIVISVIFIISFVITFLLAIIREGMFMLFNLHRLVYALQCVFGPLLFLFEVMLYLYLGFKLIEFDGVHAFLVGSITGFISALIHLTTYFTMAFLFRNLFITTFIVLMGSALMMSAFVIGGVISLLGYAIHKFILK